MRLPKDDAHYGWERDVKKIRLDPYFAAWWYGWLVCGLLLLLWGLPRFWNRLWLTVFLPPEAWAAWRKAGGLGDTLSEAVLFLRRRAPAGARWHSFYRLLPAGLAVAISADAGWLVATSAGPWVGALTGGYLTVLLLRHWDPRTL